MNWPDTLQLSPASNLTLADTLVALGLSLFCGVVVLWLYRTYYGSGNIGAGVHRSFLLGSPAITGMFLAIQHSLPLSLGLLAALAIVRFRVPVKDPAEIGFVLLVVSTSLASAILSYWLVGVLLLVALGTLLGQSLFQGRFLQSNRSYLLVSLDGPDAQQRQGALSARLASRLPGLKLESVSSSDGRLSLHYQFTRKGVLDLEALMREAHEVVAPARADILITLSWNAPVYCGVGALI